MVVLRFLLLCLCVVLSVSSDVHVTRWNVGYVVLVVAVL